MYIDTHAHLLDERFNEDRDKAFERAQNAGVKSIIEVACEPQDWQGGIELCGKNAFVRCALGIHPSSAVSITNDIWRTLETIAIDPLVVAIGETGIDYHYDKSQKDIQAAAFRRHLALAQKLNKPVSMHCREAYADFIAVLEALEKPPQGVVHCFSGSVEQAEKILSMGYYLGIDGPLTYPNSETLRNVARMAPVERLLLETDCPYLPPQQFRGKRNEPSYIPHIAAALAQIKGIPLQAVARITTENAQKLFGKLQ
jgi:TatD DNase family protein